MPPPPGHTHQEGAHPHGSGYPTHEYHLVIRLARCVGMSIVTPSACPEINHEGNHARYKAWQEQKSIADEPRTYITLTGTV